MIFIYLLSFITSVHPSTIQTNEIEIYTIDWKPTPQVCVQGRIKGLIQVYEVTSLFDNYNFLVVKNNGFKK